MEGLLQAEAGGRDPLEVLGFQIAQDPPLRKVVEAILDRCDRRGALPARMTIELHDPRERDAAIGLLSAGAVKALRGPGLRVRLDLERADRRLKENGCQPLLEVLYRATGRKPRNLKAEEVELGKRAAACATSMAEGFTGPAAAFFKEAAARLGSCQGDLFNLARDEGFTRFQDELSLMARCLQAAEANDQPVRLANFARRAMGSTKGLRAGTTRYVRVADALLRHVPGLREKVDAEQPREPSERRRLALECLNIFRNETPIDVLCFGHLVLEKVDRRLEAAAVHRSLGEPVRLLLLHLRGARIVELRANRVVSIENETTFNDYVEWVRGEGREELVLLSEGQANWAVVRLLRMINEASPGIPMVHWGDLDRFGVLILRSLRRRSGLSIDPLWMDPQTFERHAPEGLPLATGETEEINALLSASPEEVGSDLLRAIQKSERWVEQETVAEEVLGLKAQQRPKPASDRSHCAS